LQPDELQAQADASSNSSSSSTLQWPGSASEARLVELLGLTQAVKRAAAAAANKAPAAAGHS
jgi:hypothetical protein